MKKVLLIASIGFASSAYAATSVKSEYFYQTNPQQQQVTPELTYGSEKLEFTGGDQTRTTQTLNVRYEYGINEMFSAGAKIGYLTGDTDTNGATTDEKGLTDLTIYARGNYAPMDSSSLHYGADMTFSPSDRTENSDSEENNAMSGGMQITPYVGYVWLVGAGVWGANLSHELDIGDRSVEDTTSGTKTDVKRSGGNETALSGFYEQTWDKTTVGGSLSYISLNTEEDDSNGTTTETTGGNFWKLRVYPRFMISETATVVGELAYQSFLGDSVTSGGTEIDVDAYNTLSIQVGGRFTF